MWDRVEPKVVKWSQAPPNVMYGYHYEYLKIMTRIESDSLDDGISYTPTSIFSYLTRVMYSRRSKFDPLWNTVIVGGYDKEKKQP